MSHAAFIMKNWRGWHASLHYAPPLSCSLGAQQDVAYNFQHEKRVVLNTFEYSCSLGAQQDVTYSFQNERLAWVARFTTRHLIVAPLERDKMSPTFFT